jgi:hypothetical protein
VVRRGLSLLFAASLFPSEQKDPWEPEPQTQALLDHHRSSASPSLPDPPIESCRPSDRAAGIIGLFDRVGHPEFPAVFDRIYRGREGAGLRSWIANRDQAVVQHISVTPHPFSDGHRSLAGGLLGDLMADPRERNFWGPVKLVRRMVSDVRAGRATDFLITSYVPAAEVVFRAAGFTHFGDLKRHVLPLFLPYVSLRQLQHGEPRQDVTAVPFGEFPVETFSRHLRSPGTFRPRADENYFATRMPRNQYPAGPWLVAGSLDAPQAAVLTSPRSPRELDVADVFWRDDSPALAALLSATARWAIRHGCSRLTLTALEGSRLAAAAERAGFIPRPDPYPLMLLTTNASVEVPEPAAWSLTPFALTTW